MYTASGQAPRTVFSLTKDELSRAVSRSCLVSRTVSLANETLVIPDQAGDYPRGEGDNVGCGSGKK